LVGRPTDPDLEQKNKKRGLVNNLDLLKKELWSLNFAKKSKKTPKNELQQAPIDDIFMTYSWHIHDIFMTLFNQAQQSDLAVYGGSRWWETISGGWYKKIFSWTPITRKLLIMRRN
jgi:hypothetical protein